MAPKSPPSGSSSMPPCVVAPWIAYAGAAAFLPVVLGTWGMAMPWRLVVILAVPSGLIVALEAAYARPAARPGTGLQLQRWQPHWPAVGCKVAALSAIFGVILLVQSVTSEYGKRLYKPWFELLWAVGPWAALLGVAYVAAVDGWQTDEARAADRYHNLGRLLLGRRPAATMPPGCWAGLAREWLVKAFFLPLMMAFTANAITSGEEVMLEFADALNRKDYHFMWAYSCLYELIFYADVVWATFGYVLSSKLLDTHVRSAEPTFAGWAFALSCYPPFNDAVIDAYLDYTSENTVWGETFKDNYGLYVIWGSAILICSAIYLWATIMFGVRFSNLTNRGIITTGPYAFTRHPAYVFKNLSWWLIAMPWSTREGAGIAFKRCCRLLGVNAIYFARAMTEEAHLLRDPAYRAYYNAMQRRWGLPLLQEAREQQQQQEEEEEDEAEQQQAGKQGPKRSEGGKLVVA